jgi:cytochrome c peroxidase
MVVLHTEQQIETVLTTREEMATSPGQLVASINAIPAYRSLFLAAFATEQIEFAQILTAIVAFETSLVSLNSAYDRYIHGARDALSEQEINGLNIFRSSPAAVRNAIRHRAYQRPNSHHRRWKRLVSIRCGRRGRAGNACASLQSACS